MKKLSVREWAGIAVAALLVTHGGLFTLGLLVGEKGEKQAVDSAEATLRTESGEKLGDLSRRLNEKEEEVRTCERTVSNLQAALQLDEKDKKRLLEATSSEPPLAITIDGRTPVEGVIDRDVAKGTAAPTCTYFDLTIENTGNRSVNASGFTASTTAPYRVSSENCDGVDGDQNCWVALRRLDPGQRVGHSLEVCKWSDGNNLLPLNDGELLPVDLTAFSEDFLPLRRSAKLRVHPH